MISSIFKRGVENPAVPLTYDNALPFGGEATGAGVSVNADSALTYSAVWRAVNLISRDVGRIPFCVFRRDGAGKNRAPEHPSFRVLKSKPNRYQAAFVFRSMLTAHALLRGNGYALIIRRNNGVAVALLPLHPERVTPLVDDFNHRDPDAVLEYEVSDRFGVSARFKDSEILHIRNMTDDGLVGVSVVSKARESFGLGIAAERHAGRFFANNGRPSMVLEHPAHLGEDGVKTIRRTWDENHGGERNAMRPAILEEGMTAKIISVTNEDAQYLQSRQFQVREIANWFGVPPHLLADDAKASYNSLEQENQSYTDKALDPWFTAWEAEATLKLLSEREQASDSHTIEFVRQALLRADLATRGAYYQAAVGGPWLSKDEARGFESLNPLPDGAGEDVLEPLNMAATAGDSNEAELEAELDAGLEDDSARAVLDWTAHRSLLEGAFARLARRVGEQAKRAATPEKYAEFLEVRLAGASNRKVFRETVLPLLEASAAFSGLEVDEARLEEILEGEAESFFQIARASFGATSSELGVKEAATRLESETPRVWAESSIAKITRQGDDD